MTVITKYISDDGKEFDDEGECLEHELDMMECYSGLKVYGAHNKILHKFYSVNTYNSSKKIKIPSDVTFSKTALLHLRLIQDYCGFFCDIPIEENSTGTWKYDDKQEKWIKVK